MRILDHSRRARANRSVTATVLTAVVTAATLAGCGRAPADATTAAAAPTAQDPSARKPTAMVDDLRIFSPQAVIFPVSGAIYLSIENLGANDDRLLGASSPAASAIEMHESFEQEGVMRMEAHPEGFALAAGRILQLAPGGKHLMLVAPQAIPKTAAEETPSLELTLHFAQAGDLVLQVPVVDPTAVLATQGGSA